MRKIKVTQVRSSIKTLRQHRETLNSLGIRKIGQSRQHNLTPQIQGMVNRVRHLIRVEDIK